MTVTSEMDRPVKLSAEELKVHMTRTWRLDCLEEQFKPGSWRCDVCHQWSEYHIEYGPAYKALNGPAIDYPSEECSNCGYRPQVIMIEYADDWGAL